MFGHICVMCFLWSNKKQKNKFKKWINLWLSDDVCRAAPGVTWKWFQLRVRAMKQTHVQTVPAGACWRTMLFKSFPIPLEKKKNWQENKERKDFVPNRLIWQRLREGLLLLHHPYFFDLKQVLPTIVRNVTHSHCPTTLQHQPIFFLLGCPPPLSVAPPWPYIQHIQMFVLKTNFQEINMLGCGDSLTQPFYAL